MTSASKLFVACCVALALSTGARGYGVNLEGPAQQSEYTETDYNGADAGYLVLSLGVDDAGVGYHELDLDAESGDGTQKTLLPLRTESLFRSHKSDFTDGKASGDVIVRALRPGNYALTRLLVLSGANCGHGGIGAEFRLAFTVTAGKATYLGRYRYEPLSWANLWGAICSAGGYFVVSDERERDIATAKIKQTALPGEIVSALPDLAALNLPLFQPAAIAAPQPSPTALRTRNQFNEAHDLVRTEKAKARDILTTALKSGDLWQTDQALAHSWLGVIAVENSDTASAITEFSEAIRLDPGLHAAWGDRGSARLRTGDIEGAFTDMKTALNLSPRFVRWHLDLGDIEMARHHPDLAMIHYDDAIAILPGAGEPYLRRARANVLLKKFDAALGDIDNGMKSGGIKGNVGHMMRCTLGVRAGRGADALADCDKAVASDPKDAFVLSIRGYMRLAAGQPGPAVEDFDAALAMKPGTALTLYGRGVAKQKNGDAAGAKSDIDDARKVDPKVDKEAADYGFGLAEPEEPTSAP